MISLTLSKKYSLYRVEKSKIKERLEKEDISDAMQQTMKDGKARVNFAYFCQMLLSPLNLTLVYQSCHDRDKNCNFCPYHGIEYRNPCKNKKTKGNCSCTLESSHSGIYSSNICTCNSIDERKIFLKETGASSCTRTPLKKEVGTISKWNQS